MSSVLIFIDKKAPGEAKKKLADFGEVVGLETRGVVYDAISGHPDIFIFQHADGCIIAPQLPQKYVVKIKEGGIKFSSGSRDISPAYPGTAAYNALFTSYGILHNKKVGSEEVLASHSHVIHCRQAYTRCNAIEAGGLILTSDKGIEQVLVKENIPSVYVNPAGIVLEGFAHGFFGGCCGVFQHFFFICGSLRYFPDGDRVRALLQQQGFVCVELYDGPLIDTGGILFLHPEGGRSF